MQPTTADLRQIDAPAPPAPEPFTPEEREIFLEKVQRYTDSCQYPKPLNLFPVMVVPTVHTGAMFAAIYPALQLIEVDPNYDGVIVVRNIELSKNNRYKIPRIWDVLGKFTLDVWPGEKVEKVTLFYEQDVLDPRLVEEQIFAAKKFPKVYIPAKTVHNPDREFSFFEGGLLTYPGPYDGCWVIEVTYAESVRNVAGTGPDRRKRLMFEAVYVSDTDGTRKDLWETPTTIMNILETYRFSLTS